MEIKNLKATQFCDNECFHLRYLQYYFLILKLNKNHSFLCLVTEKKKHFCKRRKQNFGRLVSFLKDLDDDRQTITKKKKN